MYYYKRFKKNGTYRFKKTQRGYDSEQYYDKNGVPKLTAGNQIQMKLQNAGMDVKPLAIKQIASWSAIFTETTYNNNYLTDKYLYQSVRSPLYDLLHTNQYTTYIQSMWNEFRLISCKYKIMYREGQLVNIGYPPTNGLGNQFVSNLLFVGGWMRNGTFQPTVNFNFPSPGGSEFQVLNIIFQLPGGQSQTIGVSPPFEYNTQVVAGGDEEKNWCQTLPYSTFIAQGSPNQEFFCPNFFWAVFANSPFNNAEYNWCDFTVETEYVVECRGTKLNNL